MSQINSLNDITVQIMEYESGNLDQDGIVQLFQVLVDNGLAWSLQGHYGRTAEALIDIGLVTKRDDA